MRPIDYFTTLNNPRLTKMLETFLQNHHNLATSTLAAHSDYARYLAHVLKEGTTPNGVFGAKVMWGYLSDFISNLQDIPTYKDLPMPDLFSTAFPNLHYIRVVRQDKVSQAVSLWKAIQTGRWREDDVAASANGNGHQNGHHRREPQFHFELIDHLVRQIEEHELAWERFFAKTGIEPYRVAYEDLAAHYETTALNILRYLGVSLPEKHILAARQMKRQADALSDEWVRRYHSLKREQNKIGSRLSF